MNRTKVEKLLGKRVTVTLTDGDIITGKLHKTGEEEFKDNPNLYEPEDYYFCIKPTGYTLFRCSQIRFLKERDIKKKYELTKETITTLGGRKLHRIRALKNFADVKVGDLGGFVEKEKNLSQQGDCWVYDDAKVYEQSKVYDNAQIRNDAEVYGHSKVYGNAKVFGNAQIYHYAEIYDEAEVFYTAVVYDEAKIYGIAQVNGCSKVCNQALVMDHAVINSSLISRNALICNNAFVQNATISLDAKITDRNNYITINNFGSNNETITAFTTKNGEIYVKGYSFDSTLSEFIQEVKKMPDGSKFTKEYLLVIELIKTHFDIN